MSSGPPEPQWNDQESHGWDWYHFGNHVLPDMSAVGDWMGCISPECCMTCFMIVIVACLIIAIILIAYLNGRL